MASHRSGSIPFPNDSTPTVSSNSDTQYTPLTTAPTAASEVWDGRVYSVPWPESTYNIIDTASGRVIGLDKNNYLQLDDIKEDIGSLHKWLCVEKGGYFGFLNVSTGKYMGHDNHGSMCAVASRQAGWELMMPRKRPDGGYDLLVPGRQETMNKLCVAENKLHIVLRQHGITAWEFVRI
ncbi:hypothetical protein PT974_02435 [Cladobotryum mycophilum]|uniref:Uncharacterized protein n=1 Tax=Cladobotryum mycophilum TaxID=491253 RepID=A0ABR0SY68_9HYPO